MDLPETKLISGIAEAGHEVVVVYNPEGTFHAELSSAIKQRIPYVVRSRVDFSAVRFLRRVLEEHGPFELIHAFTGKTLSAALFATTGMAVAPVIAGYRGALGNVSRWDPTSWISFLHRRVKGISCVSDAVRDDLVKRGSTETICRRIYKGHDPSWYQQHTAMKRADLGLSEGKFIVACVANMRPNKGIDDFLAAAAELEQYPEIEYALIGQMEQARELPQYQRLTYPERVHFLGFHSPVAPLLSLVDCVVTPTKYVEGFPKSTIEAMCMHTPVIVTRVGGMKELVRDGIDGLVTEPCNPSELAQAILRLYQNPSEAHALGLAGCRRIEEEFSVHTTIAQTLEWYESLVRH